MIFAFIIHTELCSALWNYVRQVGWSLARRNLLAALGRVHFPALFMIYSTIVIVSSVCVLLRSNMADESITFELGRHVSDIIGLIERNTC